MILAIDCGSTNHKAALYNAELHCLGAGARPVEYTVRDALRVEFDPEKTWQDTVGLIRQVCAQAGVSPAQIRCIAIASQAQTFTILDAGGRPLMPCISWMDKRPAAEAAELERRLGRDFHRHCSFPAPIPQLQLSKLLWLARYQPDLLKRAATVAALPGFLAGRLAGVYAGDNNLAAMSGLYSLASGDWRPAALEICGLQRGQMCRVTQVGAAEPAQSGCRDLALAPDVKIIFAGNDQTAGAYAAAGQSRQVVLTLGTALVVYRFAGATPGPYHALGCWGPYPGGGYYELTTRDEGCAALDWAMGCLLPGVPPAAALAACLPAATAAAPGAALFYPSRIRAGQAWIGAGDPAARARAVLEGICFSARQLLEEDLGMPLDGAPLALAGGGSSNPFWLQIFADVCNCPIQTGASDVLLGAAMLARPGVAPPARPPGALSLPDPRQAADYARIYHSWRTQQPPRGSALDN